MKVLVVKTFDYSLESWKKTGTLDRELSLYKELNSKYKINFTILSWIDSETVKDLSDYGIEILPIYAGTNLSNSKLMRFFKSLIIPFKIKNILGDVDIIKQNQLLGSWFSIILKIVLKKPLFIRTGYDMYQFSKYENKNILKQFMYKFLTKISLAFADFYSVSSDTDLKKYDNKKVGLRKNWVLNEEYYPFNNRSLDRVLSVGRLEKQKDFKYLIKEVAGLNIQLDIVGEGSEKIDLQNFADEKNVNVNFLGKIDHEELENLYKEYCIYVSSSNYEGNPKTVLEALSFGCVTILSNIPNHKELVDHSKTGFIFDKKEGSLKQMFESILNNEYDLSSISKEGFSYVQNNNSLQRSVDVEMKDYNYLLQKSR